MSEDATWTPSDSDVALQKRETYLRRLGILSRKSDRRSFHKCRPWAAAWTPTTRNAFISQASENMELLSEDFVAESGLDGQKSHAINMPRTLVGETALDCQFRLNYLQKLSYEHVWLPNAKRPPRHQTIIIFDWDDTILCTGFLQRVHELPDDAKPILKEMDKVATSLLGLAVTMGQTFIITNAVKGWVEFSAGRYLPGLLPLLDQITVISARSQYESIFPKQYAKWKAEAFMEVQRNLDQQIITNLVSVGDSRIEMDAALTMGHAFEQAVVKTVKLHELPSPVELLKEQQAVHREFERIVSNPRDLRVCISGHGGRSETLLRRRSESDSKPTSSTSTCVKGFSHTSTC